MGCGRGHLGVGRGRRGDRRAWAGGAAFMHGQSGPLSLNAKAYHGRGLVFRMWRVIVNARFGLLIGAPHSDG